MSTAITIVNVADLPLEGVQRGRVNMIRRKRLPLESGVSGRDLRVLAVDCARRLFHAAAPA